MTALRRLHPYPAMIADDLASSIAARYIVPEAFVVDPFCGTGRTLVAAAEQGARCLGIDINPLAVLVANAKAARPNCHTLDGLLAALPGTPELTNQATCYDLEPDRKVTWFTSLMRLELSGLIAFINSQRLEADELAIVAVVLSATARDVSLCRKDQWKLHRVGQQKRAVFSKSAAAVFARRLSAVISEARGSRTPQGTLYALRGDARALLEVLERLPRGGRGCVDAVFTSPPYGDSRTTVGYGAVSGMCLGVVRHLSGIGDVYLSAGAIDRLCLGGARSTKGDISTCIKEVWDGPYDGKTETRVALYLSDLRSCCDQIAATLKPGGLAIFVLARRRVGGALLFLDRFIENDLHCRGLILEDRFGRNLECKRTPLEVDRRARSRLLGVGTLVATMTEELVMIFRKTSDRPKAKRAVSVCA